MRCKDCKNYYPKKRGDNCLQDGWCGSSRIAPVDSWAHCKGFTEAQKQIDIFSMISEGLLYERR